MFYEKESYIYCMQIHLYSLSMLSLSQENWVLRNGSRNGLENDFRLSSKCQLCDFLWFRHSSKTVNSEFDAITDTASTL